MILVKSHQKNSCGNVTQSDRTRIGRILLVKCVEIYINYHSSKLILKFFNSVSVTIQKIVKNELFAVSVARRGEFSRFVGFLAQKGGQIF